MKVTREMLELDELDNLHRLSQILTEARNTIICDQNILLGEAELAILKASNIVDHVWATKKVAFDQK